MGLPVPAQLKKDMRRINHAVESCANTALDKVDPPDERAFKNF